MSSTGYNPARKPLEALKELAGKSTLNWVEAERVILAVPALIAEVERLREALEPFTDIDTEGCEDMPEETRVVIKIGQRVTDYTTRLIHFRRARAALSPTPPADKEG